MCFASSVWLAYFLLREISLCGLYRCLNVPSVLCCGVVVKNFLVMVVNNAAHVRHATVVYFHVVLFEDGVEIVVWW